MKKIIFGLFILIILIFGYSYFIEPNLLFIRDISLELPIKQNIKIVVFSDLHLGKLTNGISLKRVVNKVNNLNPDLVLIPGDFVYQIKDFNRLDYLSNINAPAYAVLGNHDVGFPGKDVTEDLKQVLEKSSIKLIDNLIEEMPDMNLSLIGLSDLYQGISNFDLLSNTNKQGFVIVLAHNPDSIYSFPDDSSINLLISGHTHGGQIRVPWLYHKMIPTNHGFNRGVYKINDLDVVVTSGIGMSLLPFRFLIPPEIIALEIVPEL